MNVTVRHQMAVAAVTAALAGSLAVVAPGAQAYTPTQADPHAVTRSAAATASGTTLQHVAGAADNVYYIKNQHSGKCMTVHGASRANGAKVDQYRCISGASNQWWVVYKLAAPWGLLRVTGYQSGKCLSVLGGSTRKGAPLVQWACNGASDQLFVHDWPTSRKSALKSYRSGKCLDVQGGSTGNNAPIIQWSCNGRTNQKWYTTG